ncbi:MAG: hypothetical protein QOJ64_303 [Acidobacteriota bacterium]|jgi:hypothetical protein|nr:hypothetical protein [Acidobacteriota bacterium]
MAYWLATGMTPTASAQQNSAQPANLKVSNKNIGGAIELTFDTLLYGDVKVYLPDDMAAGDTISGTVVADPKGNTAEERAKNLDTLEGLVVEIGDQKTSALKRMFKWLVPAARPATPPHYLVRLYDIVPNKELANATLPVLSETVSTTRPGTIGAADFTLPTIGQQGRPVEVYGPFDGDFSNTSLNAGSANGSESISGDFGLIAESPRKAVFRSPTNIVGPAEIKLKEGSVDANGTFRNVGVRLSAPKTNLKSGESTIVTVQVLGLEGIQQTVPLLLVKGGVVTMEGGDIQMIPISGPMLQAGGIFILTRTITGQQTGGFSLVATVINRRFNACIQDGMKPTTWLLWNTYSGDYEFKQAGEVNGSGRGSVALQGCNFTLTHNASDRKVMASLDMCSMTGNASVQSSAPKSKFTITDRNTADNTCTSSPLPR